MQRACSGPAHKQPFEDRAKSGLTAVQVGYRSTIGVAAIFAALSDRPSRFEFINETVFLNCARLWSAPQVIA